MGRSIPVREGSRCNLAMINEQSQGTLKPVTGGCFGSTETLVTAGESTAEGLSQATSSGSAAQPITRRVGRATAGDIAQMLGGLSTPRLPVAVSIPPMAYQTSPTT